MENLSATICRQWTQMDLHAYWDRLLAKLGALLARYRRARRAEAGQSEATCGPQSRVRRVPQ